jgi:aminobenzoyl-glutamate utilization protein B
MDNRNNIWRGVDTIKPRFVDLSDRVWAMPEVCYTEAPPGFPHHRAGRRHSHRADGRMG